MLQTSLDFVGGLTDTTKMPCKSFALSAFDCNVGSRLRKIKGSVCSLCYAIRGCFRFKSSQERMKIRLAALDKEDWVKHMVISLKGAERSGFFRWFASGDLQKLSHLIKIAEVCRLTPHIQHWLSTREIGILRAYKKAGFEVPDNLIIRVSAAMIGQQPPAEVLKDFHGAAVSRDNWNCHAPAQENECRECRMCWDKGVKVVTYKYH